MLDNYQELPADSQFHEILNYAVDAIPEGISIIIISRKEPPPSLARLRANDKINLIEWKELTFTIEESKGFIRAKEGKKYPYQVIKKLYEKTGGWAAGLVLTMESSRMGGLETRPYTNSPGEIFDYFANVVFNRIDKKTCDFLMKTSVLHAMTSEMAERLTGNKESQEILSGLSRNHYFTDRYSGAITVYRYHPLFREFLLARAKGV